MNRYRAFGLTFVSSDIALPELITAQAEPDVVVRLTAPPFDTIDGKPMHSVSPTEALLRFPGAGLFKVTEGRTIEVHPCARADVTLIRLYLVGKVIATLLYQRGLLVLHASCVEIDGMAVAFIGTSCIGKSSIAAALHSCGAKIVADDVTALDFSCGQPRAIPAFPQLKVDPSVAASLGYDPETLIELHPHECRRGLRVESAFAQQPVPLGLIYLVGIDLQPSHQRVLIELIGQSYPARLLYSGGATHLQQCARLARNVTVRGLGITDARATPTELARRVKDDLAAASEQARA